MSAPYASGLQTLIPSPRFSGAFCGQIVAERLVQHGLVCEPFP
jgi:hypothetical protein